MTLDHVGMVSRAKAAHCYLLMTVWILVLVALVYKYIDDDATATTATKEKGAEEIGGGEGRRGSRNRVFRTLHDDDDARTRRIFKLCNLPQNIRRGDEGNLDDSRYKLKGVVIVLRHGDRGPLHHLRNISAVECGAEDTELLTSYKQFVQNVTSSGRFPWTGPGNSFHNFPLLPLQEHRCQLGQLTMQGVHQLLKLGESLSESYSFGATLFQNGSSPDGAAVVYSTRYRRTFQSAAAFLFGLVGGAAFTRIPLVESASMYFCFADCGCPITERLHSEVKRAIGQKLKAHPAVAALAESTGRAMFVESGVADVGADPHTVRDALLAYVCHGSGLPCENARNCVKRQNVAGVFAYTDWVNHQKWRNSHWYHLSLLRSYGLLRHLVQQMLHMVSMETARLVLYAGHDHTLESLTTTLGLLNDAQLLRFAARLVFEVYEKKSTNQDEHTKKIYFRVLVNGKDVTKSVAFCKNVVPVAGRRAALCKVEDIVRFLHDDYFGAVNASNFKDACRNS